MVDVSEKSITKRIAEAEGWLRIDPSVRRALDEGHHKKFKTITELEAICRFAGIQAAKKTSELIPMCHPLLLSQVEVTVRYTGEAGIYCRASVTVEGKTGVEMEALTAVSASLLTAYDMLKAASKDMVIADVRLNSKVGGKSGLWRRQ